jgi:uncharacterized membrane protein
MTIDALTPGARPTARRYTPAERFEIERQTFAPGGVIHQQLGDRRFAELTVDRATLHAAVRQLVAVRQAAGLTLEQVAERSGVPVGRLEHLEAMAAMNPDWLLIAGYARAVGCAVALGVSPPEWRGPSPGPHSDSR